jgi:hypothetical protein
MRYLRAVLTGLALFTPLAIHAETITVTLSMQNGDALDLSTGVGLIDGPVSVTLVGNTSQVATSGHFYQLSSFSSASLYVGGMGTFAISDPDLFVYVNQDFDGTGYGGFEDEDGGLFISVHNNSFETYALNTSFGPYTSNSEMDGIEYADTIGGEFEFDSDQFTNVTYLATVSGATPEPSPVALLVTGLAGLAGVTRRRFVRR